MPCGKKKVRGNCQAIREEPKLYANVFIKEYKAPDLCQWLHEKLESLPTISYPFKLEQLPENGIYFFYENGEIWGHKGDKLRMVRIGTHKKGNFRSRIREHFLINECKINFDKDKPKPSDRSIFRKNIGRALLNKNNDKYLEIWDVDFTCLKNRELFRNKRDVEKEKIIETKITEILRENFSFRFLVIEDEKERIGSLGLESSLIGTIASCELCRPSNNWLGNYSPITKIRESGLWLVQHLKTKSINEDDKKTILNAIEKTIEWWKEVKFKRG